MNINENYQNEVLPTNGVRKIPHPRQYSFREKLLLPISLLVAILFDRLLVVGLFGASNIGMLFGAFWLCYMAVFYSFYWKRLKQDKVAWLVAACTAALCLWYFIFPYHNWQFATITVLVIPNVLMAHAQWTAGAYTLKNSDGMASAWFFGWFVKPFSGLPALFGAISSLLSAGNKSVAKRALIGICIALALMLVVIPLLMSADQVFNHYLRQMFSGGGNWHITILHIFVVIIAFGLFYSLWWNVGYGKTTQYRISGTKTIDNVISYIVLNSVMTAYILFCTIQFTYLFASAGLPAGMTYYEYARQGFAQTVVYAQ